MTDLQHLSARIAAYAKADRPRTGRGQLVLSGADDLLLEIAVTRFPRILTFSNTAEQSLHLWVRGGRVFGMSADTDMICHDLEGDAGAADLNQAIDTLLAHTGEILLQSQRWDDVTRDGKTGVVPTHRDGQVTKTSGRLAEIDLKTGQIAADNPEDRETIQALAATSLVQTWVGRPEAQTVTLGSEPAAFQISLIATGDRRTLRLTRTS